MKILIAEDNQIASKVLRLTLQHLGHEVVATSDGQEAWEMFDREPVRVVVSDWMMPRVDGLDLCKLIRERPSIPYTYFIILTAAHTSGEDYTLAMDSGVDDFLTKPLDREILRTRLRVAERIIGFATEISQLRDMIPMCSYCHKIRSDQDYWQRIENYLSDRTGDQISHGICPDCMAEQLASLQKMTAVRRDLVG